MCQCEFFDQRELAGEFTGGTQGNFDKARKIGIGRARRTFRDIARDRNGGGTHLRAKPESLLERQQRGSAIDVDYQLFRTPIHFEFVMVPHCRLFIFGQESRSCACGVQSRFIKYGGIDQKCAVG